MASANVGDKFGKLTVVSFYESVRDSGSIKRMASVSCDCGNVLGVEKYNLTNGNTSQCQECARKSRAKNRVTHGHSDSKKNENPIGYSCYTRWQAMKRRCYSEADKRYKDYGGRGIRVCDRWLHSYENFLSDMGLPPAIGYQIDRKDNDGDYEPGNCHWVSQSENSRNKRNSRFITAFGKTATLSEWAEETGIKRETIARRLNSGLCAESALDTKLKKPGATRRVRCPSGEYDTITDMAKAVEMSISGAHHRVNSERYPDWCYI